MDISEFPVKEATKDAISPTIRMQTIVRIEISKVENKD